MNQTHNEPASMHDMGASIYWMLPGPMAIWDRMRQAMSRHRVTVITTHKSPTEGSTVVGFEPAFERALRAAHPPNSPPIRVVVQDGTHIASDVGLHLGRQTLDPREAAAHGEIPGLEGRRLIVLMPKTDKAIEKCQRYAVDFLHAVNDLNQDALLDSGLSLVVLKTDGAVNGAANWSAIEGLHQLAFDGALSLDEMNAYVGMCMLGRRGPGSTSLAQHLVSQFAGFDAVFAQALMRLSEADLLELPESLARVDFALGQDSPLGNRHVMQEWRLAQHEGHLRDGALRSLDSRYWRASLLALMPWLEERRSFVVEVLRPELTVLLNATNGVMQRMTPGGFWDVRINDLEYSDVVQLVRDSRYRFRAESKRAQAAVDVCFAVKGVRNDMAHLKPPNANAIRQMIRSMDSFTAIA